MNTSFLPNFNLDITLLGGQSFAWDKDPVTGIYTGFTSDRIIKIKRDIYSPDNILWQTYPVKDDWGWLSNYLRAEVDYEHIIEHISKDENIRKAVKHFKGLRLLKQDFNDTVIGYLCSATKSIVGIRQCVRLMRDKFGDEIIVEGEAYKLFPKVTQLSLATPTELRECKVGFRAQNIKQAAEVLTNSNLSSRIHNLSPSEAIEELKKLRGVGDKVADCIAIYSLAHDELTPFDVWGVRALNRYYGVSEKTKYSQMRAWVKQYFGNYASWAGQFLFEYIRLVDVK